MLLVQWFSGAFLYIGAIFQRWPDLRSINGVEINVRQIFSKVGKGSLYWQTTGKRICSVRDHEGKLVEKSSEWSSVGEMFQWKII